MAFVVVYDACVLYPASVRDLLIRIANTGVVRARWSDRILDECFRNVAENQHHIPAPALERTRRLMNEAVPDCLVQGYEDLEAGLDLPDPDDRHVLAAAIRTGAQAIVTYNLRDFPDHILERYDIESKHPDEFVLDTLDLAPGAVVQCVTDQATSYRKPPMSVPELLDTLRRRELVRSVAKLRDLLRASGESQS